MLACTLSREDARDALILGPGCGAPDPADPLAALPRGARVGTSSVRRQAQLLHARPDLRVVLLRGNVQTRLARVREGAVDASLLALAGLRRLGLEGEASAVLAPEIMLPAAGQGIVGVTVRGGRHRAARPARRDRGPGRPRRGDRRAGAAGGAGRFLPHADRWLRAAAAMTGG